MNEQPHFACSAAGWRERLQRALDSVPAQRLVTSLIILNAATLGLETSRAAMAAAGDVLMLLDRVVLALFVIEISLRMIAAGRRFFRGGWNVFDFAVVAISLVPNTGGLSILRALRVLRVLRLVSVVPQMRQVVQALLSAIPGMASIIALLVIVYYVFAVMATRLFGHSFPEFFGSLGASLYSLFEVMTLDGWSTDLVRPVMETYPLAWLFFVPFILLTSFAVLNLFIAIIVNAMQAEHEAEQRVAADRIAGAAHADAARLLAEIGELRAELRALRGELDRR